jgi:hypothetical protein
MMKNTIYGLFCLVSVSLIVPAFADEVIKTFPGGSANDMINNTEPPGAKDKPMGAIKMHKKCRDDKGALIDEGTPGYEACLKSMLKRPKRSPIPEAPADAGAAPHSSKVKPATK